MTSDDRPTGNLFLNIVGVLERHGYRLSGNYHVEQVIHAVSDLTRTYEGTEAAPDAVVVSGAEAITVFAALDIAADDKRYRVEMCPDCPDQSCPDLPDQPPGRPCLRPDGRPHAPGRQNRPGRPRRAT